MADAFFTRNRDWLRSRVNQLYAERWFAAVDGNTAAISAIDANLKYYRTAMVNNDGGLFPIDTMETVHG